jgi:hypothetical protein
VHKVLKDLPAQLPVLRVLKGYKEVKVRRVLPVSQEFKVTLSQVRKEIKETQEVKV